jgi:hypothetical protein
MTKIISYLALLAGPMTMVIYFLKFMASVGLM